MKIVKCVAGTLALMMTANVARAQDADAESTSSLASLSRLYGGVEYLGWWVKGAPLSVPLVSTGPISTTHHGWLSSPDSTILYGAHFGVAQGGNNTQPLPYFSGGRLTLGYHLDDAQRYAVEVSGFGLQNGSAGFEVDGNQNGLPVINIPVFNTTPYTPGGRPGGLPPAEDGLPASLPSDPDRFDSNAGVFTGRVKITNSLQLWGTSLSAVDTFYRTPSWEISGLAGFRYLHLAEKFHMYYESSGISGAYAGQFGTANDVFSTENGFYGSSLGIRGRYIYGPFSVEAAASVAFGASREVLNVNGGFAVYNYFGPARSGPEGVFAQPANEGQFSSTHFAVVPEVQFKLGYNITPSMQVTIGYDFLYDSNVIRPTDQIDRNIPKGQTFLQGGNFVSTTSPARFFRTTDFFAQGLSLGVTYRF